MHDNDELKYFIFWNGGSSRLVTALGKTNNYNALSMVNKGNFLCGIVVCKGVEMRFF
jgi:hypothetical protein